MKKIQTTLTYADALLVPHHAASFSPETVNLTSIISGNIELSLPIISSGMPTVTDSTMAIELARHGGIGIIHPFFNSEGLIKEINKAKAAGIKFGISLGENDWEKVHIAYKYHVDFIAIDSPHGDCDTSLDFISKIKQKYPKLIIFSGFFVSKTGVKKAIDAGADAIRVGIGPGSHCTTRIVAGVGVPQLSAILECATITKKFGIPLIADGGISNSGDIVKALAAGASAVIIGGMFAGTNQSPGKIITIKGKKYKRSWGHCSIKAETGSMNVSFRNRLKRTFIRVFDKEINAKQPKISEGVENAIVNYKGDVGLILQQLRSGIALGMSYMGAKDIKQLQNNAHFVSITNAGLVESFPHHVEIIAK